MQDQFHEKAPRPSSEHRRSPSSSSGRKSSSSASNAGHGALYSPTSLPCLPAAIVNTPLGRDEKEFVREKIAMDADLYINNPSYSDFRFKVGASEVGLSAIVLAANSTFMQLKIDSERCKGIDVSTLELDIDQITELAKPLYNGRLVLSSKNILNNLMFSTLLEFQWIFDCCIVYFTEYIRPELVFDFLELCLRSQNHCLERYKTVLKLCGKYLEENNKMSLLCSYIKETNQTSRLNRDAIDYLCKIDSPNVIDVISLILVWLKLDKANMPIVPSLLDSFDFPELFKQNEELAESFFTHIITGDYTAQVRMRIMNLSFQSCKNVRTKNKPSFRMVRLKSNKKMSEDSEVN